MYLPDFEVFEPKSIQEACSELHRYREHGVGIIAGGTDFLVDIRPKIILQHLPRCQGCIDSGGTAREPKKCPPYVVSLSRIPEIRGIMEDGNHIRIGAMTTIRELCESALIKKELTALYDGASQLGSPLVRNRGTLGGNIANARPAADTFVASVALNADLAIESVNGKRDIPVISFAKAPGVTMLTPIDIITHLKFPVHHRSTGSSYIKLVNRKSLEIAIVGIACMLVLDDHHEQIENARIAMGAVGPTPLLAQSAMGFLIGKPPRDEIFREAAKLALKDAHAISDHRGSKHYREIEIEVLTLRSLQRAMSVAAMSKNMDNKKPSGK